MSVLVVVVAVPVIVMSVLSVVVAGPVIVMSVLSVVVAVVVIVAPVGFVLSALANLKIGQSPRWQPVARRFAKRAILGERARMAGSSLCCLSC